MVRGRNAWGSTRQMAHGVYRWYSIIAAGYRYRSTRRLTCRRFTDITWIYGVGSNVQIGYADPQIDDTADGAVESTADGTGSCTSDNTASGARTQMAHGMLVHQITHRILYVGSTAVDITRGFGLATDPGIPGSTGRRGCRMSGWWIHGTDGTQVQYTDDWHADSTVPGSYR